MIMEKIEDVLFYTIDKSIKTYRQYAQKKLISAGHSITIDQWLVLTVLKDYPEISQSEIADKVFKDNASVTRIIELLVKSNLLKRSVQSQDRRRTNISITTKGEKSLVEVKQIVLNNRKNALRGISKDEIKLLNTLLNKIITNCFE